MPKTAHHPPYHGARELELQIALLSEQENTKMLQMLEAIAHKVGAPIKDDPDI